MPIANSQQPFYSQTKPTTMLKFNTKAGLHDRLHLSLEQVFKGSPRTLRTLKTGLIAAILFCCFSYQNLTAQCNIGYAPGVTGDVQLSLDNSGTAILNGTFLKVHCARALLNVGLPRPLSTP